LFLISRGTLVAAAVSILFWWERKKNCTESGLEEPATSDTLGKRSTTRPLKQNKS